MELQKHCFKEETANEKKQESRVETWLGGSKHVLLLQRTLSAQPKPGTYVR